VRGLSRRPNFELRHYRLVSSHHARPSSARSDRLPSLVPCGFRREVREPRAAGPREILPSLACGQRREDVGQGDVGPEPRLKPVTAQLLARPQRSQSMRTTSKGNSPIGCEPMRFIATRRPGSSISLACDLCASLPPVPGRKATGTGGKDAPSTVVFTSARRGLGDLPRAIRSDAPSICGRTSDRACFFWPIFCAFPPCPMAMRTGACACLGAASPFVRAGVTMLRRDSWG
jgi:hypothetical protein